MGLRRWLEAILVLCLGFLGLLIVMLFRKPRCPACGAELRRGEPICHSCGVMLEWR